MGGRRPGRPAGRLRPPAALRRRDLPHRRPDRGLPLRLADLPARDLAAGGAGAARPPLRPPPDPVGRLFRSHPHRRSDGPRDQRHPADPHGGRDGPGGPQRRAGHGGRGDRLHDGHRPAADRARADPDAADRRGGPHVQPPDAPSLPGRAGLGQRGDRGRARASGGHPSDSGARAPGRRVPAGGGRLARQRGRKPEAGARHRRLLPHDAPADQSQHGDRALLRRPHDRSLHHHARGFRGLHQLPGAPDLADDGARLGHQPDPARPGLARAGPRHPGTPGRHPRRGGRRTAGAPGRGTPLRGRRLRLRKRRRFSGGAAR